MECPSCGQDNSPDRLECQYCETLLVDVFATGEDGKDEKTDPISRIGLSKSVATDFETAYSRRFAASQYTGDLPRLFRFGDRYQILEKLGEGGMGRVYKALDLELDRPVALKTIRAERGTGPDLLKRFKQELVLARKVTHKNVVRIYDLGEAEGMKFFTMELIEGRSLRDELQERGRIPAKEAVGFLKQMLGGLAEAHAQGVVHRDLKPQNIMIDESGGLRIMDFGIARTADTATLTGTGEMMGTPDYISPEQVRGENADAQSDLYSLGVILYEMLTGEVPFKGDTAVSKIVARIQVKPPAPRSLCPDIPAYVERIVLKLMEMDTDLRYKTAEEVLQDIEREQVDRSVVLRTRKAMSRYRWWIAVAGLIASLGIGTWVYLNGEVRGDQLPDDVTTVAFVPISNLRPSEELDWLEEGIPEMLVTNVSQSRALRPVLPERVHRILRDIGREGESRFDAETLRAISQTAASDYTLFGSFAESGGELRLNLTLRETSTGVDIPLTAAGSSSQVFEIVDELTEHLKDAVGAGRWERDPRSPTHSVEAFRAFSEGLQALRDGALQDAIGLFQEAVGHDEGFAMAHARLAEAHFLRNDLVAAKAALEEVLPLLEGSSISVVERYQIQAISARIDEDPTRAVEAYGKLAELYPEDPDIILGYASAVETMGKNAQAAAEYRRVLDLNPDFGAAILGLGRSLNSSGQPEEAIALLRGALEAGRFANDLEGKGMAYSVLGVALRDMGRFEEAIPVLQVSLDARKQSGDLRGVMATLTNLATAHQKIRRFRQAETLLNEALATARESRNETMESFALLNLGNVYWDTGDLNGALQCYLDSLAIELERKEHQELGHRLDAIASIHLRRGALAEATVFLEQARLHLQSSGDQRELGYNEILAGQVAVAQGKHGNAIESYFKALSILQGTGQKETIAQGQLALSDVYANQGRFEESFRALTLSVSGYRDLGMTQEAGYALLLLASIATEFDALEASEAILQSSEVRALESTSYRTVLHFALGELKRRKGECSEAATLFAGVMDTARSSDEMPLAIRGQIGFGAVQAEQGAKREALDTLRSAHASAARLRLRELETRAGLSLAETQFAVGDVESAMTTAEEARTLAESFEGRPLTLRAYRLQAAIASSQGNVDAAEHHWTEVRRLEQTLVTRLEPQPGLPEESSQILPEARMLREALTDMLQHAATKKIAASERPR